MVRVTDASPSHSAAPISGKGSLGYETGGSSGGARSKMVVTRETGTSATIAAYEPDCEALSSNVPVGMAMLTLGWTSVTRAAYEPDFGVNSDSNRPDTTPVGGTPSSASTSLSVMGVS